jgi:hypothetical protein
MPNKLQKKLVKHFKGFSFELLFVRNPDRFLYRDDIKVMLGENGIRVVEKSGIQLRIDYEINYKREQQPTIYLLENVDLPEDLMKRGQSIVFLLKDVFPELHSNSIINLPLPLLETLYLNKPETGLNKKDTDFLINTILANNTKQLTTIDLAILEKEVDQLLQEEQIDWHAAIQLISNAISKTIGQSDFDKVLGLVERYNRTFQKEINHNYQQVLSASFIKKPRIVSSILKFLSHNSLDSKVALIIIDGMTFWQYQLLEAELKGKVWIENDITYSWIPSITQLSRQAIFKGDYPDKSYVQNPKNEEKLWRGYWWNAGISEHQIDYAYNEWKTGDLQNISKYAGVFTGLDDKMHSCTDYVDLKSLTLNWIKKSGMVRGIQTLVASGFQVYLTTDHGNVPAVGWRNLKDDEKVGTYKNGSRSARHVSYSDKWMAEKFLESNPDLSQSISMDKDEIYFTDLKSFSHQKELITHGGSHLLEVIIPFVKITHES